MIGDNELSTCALLPFLFIDLTCVNFLHYYDYLYNVKYVEDNLFSVVMIIRIIFMLLEANNLRQFYIH